MGTWLLPVSLLWLPLCPQSPAGSAYDALRAGRLDEANSLFRQSLSSGAGTVGLRKDFAYTLLKTGDREEAMEQFEAVMRLDPSDERAALEYAFLCFELKRERDARRTFDRLRQSRNAEVAATASTAFENIDGPLREGIARWKSAIESAPGQWSAHQELAGLAARRDELALAEAHYREALRLKPGKSDLLYELALVLRTAGKEREAIACLLALSRGREPRTAERARALMPERYPYVYEFEDAIRVDPSNEELARELDELLFAMDKKAPPRASAKQMGLRSLEKSYLNDALRYLRIAQEENPDDAEVATKLGLTYNLMRRDDQALVWLDRGRRLGDPEAERAYRNLKASRRRFHLTGWALPVYSSRWSDLFLYGQVKGEWKLWRVRPYLSVRINGDVRGSMPGAFGPLYLSENSVITAAGVGMPRKHGLYFWVEAGQSFSREGSRPDFRGGAALFHRWRLGARSFVESATDGVYLSRYQNDFLVYAQNRAGWRPIGVESGALLEVHLNANLTADTRGDAWANFTEFGPGVKMRWRGLPAGMSLRVDFVRGVYTRNEGNPQRPNFWEFRSGIWYALSR